MEKNQKHLETAQCPDCGVISSYKAGYEDGIRIFYCKNKDCRKKTFREFYVRGPWSKREPGITNPVDNNVPVSGVQTITEAEIREKYDKKYIVQKHAKMIKEGEFYDEDSFIRFCSLNPRVPGFRKALDSPEFKIYKGKADGDVYWGHPSSVEKLKNDGTFI